VRRRVVPVALLLFLLAGLGVALLGGPSGDEVPARASAAQAAPGAAPADEADALPPLPEARPKVVEPVAGETAGGDEDSEAVVVEEDDSNDARPTRAASTSRPGGRRAATSSGDAVNEATALPNGVALPPLEAPDEVLRIIEAGNSIAKTPYKWGGGHGKWQDTGYDCSGSVSFALASAGLMNAPLASGPFMKWGKPGKGKWVTIYTNPGHMFMEVAGIRFDTSGARKTGSRWQNDKRPLAAYVARHPPGL